MESQQNNSLEYRETLVKAKRTWDENPSQKIYDQNDIFGKTILSRQKELEILGGGVAILSKAEGKPILLYSPEVQKHFKIKENADLYEYLYTPYNVNWVKPGCEQFIDLLFFISRDKPTPEYVSTIADISKNHVFEYPFQYELRKRYEILHCSTGEILFFCLLWRLIIELINKNNCLNCEYSDVLFKSVDYGSNWVDVFKTDGFDLFEKMIINKLDVAAISPTNELSKKVLDARDLFLENLKRDVSVNYIFTDLDLFNKTALKEINRYTAFVFNNTLINLTKKNADEYAHQAILAFVNKTNLAGKSFSLGELLNALHSNSRFPILPYYFLMLFDTKKELKEHVVFPLWYTTSSDTKYVYDKDKKESAVLHALYTVKPIWNNKNYNSYKWYTCDGIIENPKINPEFENYLNHLYSFFTSISKPIIDKEYYAAEIKKNIYQIKSQAVRAAISQVMARNTAHNIASHVLAQLTDGDFLSKEKNQEWTCTSYDPQFVSDARIIYQIASLISYIKDRMEYLGDITFGIPTMQANKKLSEVQKELDKVWLLLDHISGLSEFRYTITFCADDKPIVDSNSGNLIPENDLTIAMTNDILGMQALFNIIENVIRNTAKHNQSKPDNKEDKEKRITTFYVNFIDYDADYYEVEIYDDVPVSGNKKFDVTEESVEKEAEYRSKTNTNTGEDISNIDWLVYSMNCNINCSVLDEDNKLRGHSLGILEMEASAAYLRKLDIVDIENDEYDVTFDEKEKFRVDKLNILKAFKKEIKDKDGKNAKTWLAYRIFISKPKEYLFVGLDVKNIDTRHLNKLGIDFISTDDFKKKLENRSVYHHQFVFHQECFTPTPEQKTQLPLRIVPLPLDESNELLNKLIIGNFAQIEEQVWSIWFEKIKGDYKTVNVMTSYQEQYHKQGNPFNLCYCDHSKEWDKRVKEFNDNNIHFLEPLSSAAQQKLPSIKSNHELADYIYELKGEAIKYKLFEAAISKVLVIDERIQRFSDTSYISTPNKDIFSKSHVTIPGSEKLKLDADNYDLEFKKRLENYIDTEVKTNTYKFMLIHFGILERLFKENPSEIEVNLKKWSEQTRVVVTSGRGRPKELLPPEICFVNLSSVLRIFTQTRNKYSINYLLNQARK